LWVRAHWLHVTDQRQLSVLLSKAIEVFVVDLVSNAAAIRTLEDRENVVVVANDDDDEEPTSTTIDVRHFRQAFQLAQFDFLQDLDSNSTRSQSSSQSSSASSGDRTLTDVFLVDHASRDVGRLTITFFNADGRFGVRGELRCTLLLRRPSLAVVVDDDGAAVDESAYYIEGAFGDGSLSASVASFVVNAKSTDTMTANADANRDQEVYGNLKFNQFAPHELRGVTAVRSSHLTESTCKCVPLVVGANDLPQKCLVDVLDRSFLGELELTFDRRAIVEGVVGVVRVRASLQCKSAVCSEAVASNTCV
jgi:hypothetical protein